MQRLFILGSILLLSLLAGSCSRAQPATADILQSGFADLRATAETTINDPVRRARYLEYSRNLESELMAFEGFATGFVEQYRKAFTDYDSDQVRLKELSAEFRERQRAAQDRFVDLHLAMAATVTPDEWQPLSNMEGQIIKALLAAATKDGK